MGTCWQGSPIVEERTASGKDRFYFLRVMHEIMADLMVPGALEDAIANDCSVSGGLSAKTPPAERFYGDIEGMQVLGCHDKVAFRHSIVADHRGKQYMISDIARKLPALHEIDALALQLEKLIAAKPPDLYAIRKVYDKLQPQVAVKLHLIDSNKRCNLDHVSVLIEDWDAFQRGTQMNSFMLVKVKADDDDVTRLIVHGSSYKCSQYVALCAAPRKGSVNLRWRCGYDGFDTHGFAKSTGSIIGGYYNYADKGWRPITALVDGISSHCLYAVLIKEVSSLHQAIPVVACLRDGSRGAVTISGSLIAMVSDKAETDKMQLRKGSSAWNRMEAALMIGYDHGIKSSEVDIMDARRVMDYRDHVKLHAYYSNKDAEKQRRALSLSGDVDAFKSMLVCEFHAEEHEYDSESKLTDIDIEIVPFNNLMSVVVCGMHVFSGIAHRLQALAKKIGEKNMPAERWLESVEQHDRDWCLLNGVRWVESCLDKGGHKENQQKTIWKLYRLAQAMSRLREFEIAGLILLTCRLMFGLLRLSHSSRQGHFFVSF